MNQAFQYQRLVLVYHGCNQSVADEALLKGAALKQSQKSYDWLGNGIYFWEHGPERALEWAQGRKNAKNPTVVGAIIHLGNCFDLLDRKATKLLSIFNCLSLYGENSAATQTQWFSACAAF